MNTHPCAWCGRNYRGDVCPSCSAPARDTEKIAPQEERAEPFSYNGLVVWPIRKPFRDEVEFHFYAGEKLLQIISFSGELWRQLSDEHPGLDMFPSVWKMFLVATGEVDGAMWLENKKVMPATFVITRYEHPDRERIRNLSYEQAIEEFGSVQLF